MDSICYFCSHYQAEIIIFLLSQSYMLVFDLIYTLVHQLLVHKLYHPLTRASTGRTIDQELAFSQLVVSCINVYLFYCIIMYKTAF